LVCGQSTFRIFSLAADGTMPTAHVTSATWISISVRKAVTDIKPGDFIASGGTIGREGKTPRQRNPDIRRAWR
jgi:hypothetical protein